MIYGTIITEAVIWLLIELGTALTDIKCFKRIINACAWLTRNRCDPFEVFRVGSLCALSCETNNKA